MIPTDLLTTNATGTVASNVYCPALIISGPASNQGKTTITASLAYYHRQQGRKVRVFKVGPDFLDPTILEIASANPVYQLDLWMMGRENCGRLLHEAAQDADLILIEGVMGLFDGYSSTADLAREFGIPVVVVIKAESMAQSFHAIAHGLATYDPQIKIAGVFANAVGSIRHATLIAESTRGELPYLGSFVRSAEVALPSRHLGLVPAHETLDLETRLASGAKCLKDTALCQMPEVISFAPPNHHNKIEPVLAGRKIAVAKDAAFSFLYRRNLEVLKELGADVIEFSPLSDMTMPDCESLYLPGGYPELHLQALSTNEGMKSSVQAHFSNGGRIYAECGGMLYLLRSLIDKDGQRGAMVGLLPGKAVLGTKLVRLGYQQFKLAGQTIKGHTFHYSHAHIARVPFSHASNPFGAEPGEAAYKLDGLWASYVHMYFDSNPVVAASFFGSSATITPVPFFTDCR